MQELYFSHMKPSYWHWLFVEWLSKIHLIFFNLHIQPINTYVLERWILYQLLVTSKHFTLANTSLYKGRVGLIDNGIDSTASWKSLSEGKVGLTKDEIGSITSGSLSKRRVGSTKDDIGSTTWSTKGWLGCWETIGCSGEGNYWASNHTLR